MTPIDSKAELIEMITSSFHEAMANPGEEFEVRVLMQHQEPNAIAKVRFELDYDSLEQADYVGELTCHQALDLLEYFEDQAVYAQCVFPEIGVNSIESSIRDNFERGYGDQIAMDNMVQSLIYKNAVFQGYVTELTVTVNADASVDIASMTHISLTADTSVQDKAFMKEHDLEDIILPVTPKYYCIPVSTVTTRTFQRL